MKTPTWLCGLSLPRVIFGTTAFGNLYEEMPDQTRRDVMAQMLEHVPGVIALDSAGKYGAGLALESLAAALTEQNVPQQRVLISNKLGWRRVPLKGKEPTFEPGAWVGLQHDAVLDISHDGILRCWEEGKRFLNGYTAQLLSVHDPDEYLAAASSPTERASRWQDILDAYRALEELRRNGKARAIGVGSKDWRISQQICQQCRLDWVMIANSLTPYRHEPELLEFLASLKQRGIAVINAAVFHGGFLVGGSFFDYRKTDRSSHATLYQWRDKFHEMCQQFDVQPAHACVAFGVSPPGIASIALSASHPEFVRSAIAMLDAPIDDSFWTAMKDDGLIAPDYPYL